MQLCDSPFWRCETFPMRRSARSKPKESMPPRGGFLSLAVPALDRWPINCTRPQNGKLNALLIATVGKQRAGPFELCPATTRIDTIDLETGCCNGRNRVRSRPKAQTA
jgi:hypothetical protein